MNNKNSTQPHLQSNLRKAACCENCKHCVAESPYDDPTSYYCNFTKTYKPEQPNLLWLEGDRSQNVLEYREYQDYRLKWATEHQVSAGQVCDLYAAEDTQPSTTQLPTTHQTDLIIPFQVGDIVPFALGPIEPQQI